MKDKILELVKEYYRTQHAAKRYKPGDPVRYAGRVYDEQELMNLVSASLDFWLTSGEWTAKIEQGLADYLGVKYCSFVNSGSSANLAAFMALTSPKLGGRRIKRGDEVITVAAGFPTTVAPIIQYGAVPVFVDVELATANVDASQLEAALSPKTKAVMLAHTLGNTFDLQAVKEFCERNHLWLIEDNCDALGSEYFIIWKLAEDRHDRRHRNVELLPASPHDDGRGRSCLHEQPGTPQAGQLVPGLGAGLLVSFRA